VGCNSKQTGTNLLKKIGINVTEEIVDAGIGYCSAFYKFEEPITIDGVKDPRIIIIQTCPEQGENKGLAIGRMEGGIYHFNWYGFSKDYPAPTDEGVLEYSKHLRYQGIGDLLAKGKRISPIVPYRDVCSRRVRCDTSKDWPENYIILGDAMANYTPTFGQGMTFAALSAEALNDVLSESTDMKGLSKMYIKRVFPILDLCWNGSVGEDLCVPGVTFNCDGPPGYRFFHNYLNLLFQYVTENEAPRVRNTIVKVMNMVIPPYHLLSPPVAIRAIEQLIKNRFRKTLK